MFRTALLIALIGFAACDRLKVSAYIESQCPDCINFIKLSVIKTLAISDIDQILDLEFVPYGNAKQQLLPDGSYGFTCQHGAIECHGNLLEACALHNLEGYRLPCDCTRFYQQVSWIACLEDKRKVSSVQFDVDAKTCSASYPGLYDAIQKCVNGPEGNYLQHQAADQTEALIPAHNYVPWITVAGEHNLDHENNIIADIVQWACKNYQGETKISACSIYLD